MHIRINDTMRAFKNHITRNNDHSIISEDIDMMFLEQRIKELKGKFDIPTLLLFLTFSLYFIGGTLIKEDRDLLQKRGRIRESYVYTDQYGEEQAGEELIEIKGIGRVLSYKDLYFSTPVFLIISCILAKVIFNSTDEVRFMIYTNCILGLMLIWLTTKSNLPSTILYWCGIMTASFIGKKDKAIATRRYY